jgi:DNA modification methylase
MTATILRGDVLTALRGMPSVSFDAALADPPYGLKFPGLDWDKVLPPAEVWVELTRVLRPAANVLIFGGSRTFHRLAVSLEDAGFVVLDVLMWLHGQGQPKSRGLLKPAYEPIVLARSPGTSSPRPLNVDGCRIGGGLGDARRGRWPANVAFDDEAAAALDQHAGITSVTGKRSERSREATVKGTKRGIDNHKSTEYLDSGHASRFFYCPKVKGVERRHPTQKPVELTEWLGRLLQVTDGRLLVPYAGVGSEMVGALAAGWHEVVGIEANDGYVDAAEQRLRGGI